MAPTWESLVVARLRQLRADEGPNFDRHWRHAMLAYPMRNWGRGNSAPRLFDEDGHATDTQLGFFKAVAEKAYYNVVGPRGSGNGPELRHFCPEMVLELDNSEPARRSTLSVGRVRQAA